MCKIEPVDTVEYKGFTIEIYPDYHPIDPVSEWDMLGTMVCAHRRYNLGHVQVDNVIQGYEEMLTSEQISQALAGEARVDWEVCGHIEEESLPRLDKALEKYVIALPLYLYDHGMLSMSTGAFSCPWDSGQVGMVYVTKEQVREEWGWKRITEKRREQIEKSLKAEVRVYSDYLSGSVYGYVVPVADEEIDSCWSFYGGDFESNGLMECAKSAIDAELREREKREEEERERDRQDGFAWVEMLVDKVEEF